MIGETPLIVLFGVMIVFVAAIVLWVAARRFRRQLGMREEKREKTTDTSFVISAFHEVTKQLKENEKELERLKALAEQRAENIESFNENILQCVTSGVMTFDREFRLMTLNRAAEEILGLDREQMKGVLCREVFKDGDIARAVQETMDRRRSSARLEAIYERDRGTVWLGFNTAVLSDRQGDALGVILSFSDLTEVKRLQEQVELRERLTALGEMSAGIAHELRNPMAVMSGYLTLLSKKAGKEQQAIIQSVAAEIDGMNRIIGDLLTFARPAALNRVKADIKELIESCVANALAATKAEERITVDAKLDPIEVSIDEVLMRQALTNLVQNAIESMPSGGTLSVSVRKAPGEALISVRDTGTGMRQDVIKKIFLPFFTTKDKGVGMGLALTHKIVSSHGGRIEVESREGVGTNFTVVLPLK